MGVTAVSFYVWVIGLKRNEFQDYVWPSTRKRILLSSVSDALFELYDFAGHPTIYMPRMSAKKA